MYLGSLGLQVETMERTMRTPRSDEPDVQAVLDLLPEPADDAWQLGGPGRPWFVRYGTRKAVIRSNELAMLERLRFPRDMAIASTAWLHAYLRDLSAVGFVAPAPLNDLDGESYRVIGGSLWELLTFIPGRPMEWPDERGLWDAGRLLAQYHDACVLAGPRAQRPGALPMTESFPSDPDARRVQAQLRHELAEIGHESALRGVIHGDATNINVVIDESTLHLVDFAIAYEEALAADVACALWRNGRVTADAVVYEPTRLARFVQGYASVRRVGRLAGRTTVVYLKARGLQLQRRMELRGRRDETVMQRLLWIAARQDELSEAIDRALEQVGEIHERHNT